MTAPLPAQQVLIHADCDRCGFSGQVTAFQNRAASDLATLTWFCPQCGTGHTRLQEITPGMGKASRLPTGEEDDFSGDQQDAVHLADPQTPKMQTKGEQNT